MAAADSQNVGARGEKVMGVEGYSHTRHKSPSPSCSLARQVYYKASFDKSPLNLWLDVPSPLLLNAPVMHVMVLRLGTAYLP